MTDDIADLETDDELTREQGMADGPKRVSRFTLRPVTAVSLSWLQRNKVFDDDAGDMLQKTAAFTYLHTEDKATIRAVVNNQEKFLQAVDEWMDRNIAHHTELEPISEEMNAALESYMAATTTASHPHPASPAGPKN